MKELREVFNFYDYDNGRLSREICQELLQAVGEDIGQVNHLFSPPSSLDRFLFGWNLLHRSLSDDIIPALQKHIQQKLQDEAADNVDSRNEILRRNELAMDESSLRKKPGRGKVREKDPGLGQAFGRRPSVADLMVKNILWSDPSVDVQAQLHERQLHRRRTSEILDQRLAERPDINSLVERGIIIDTNDSFVAEAGSAMQRVHTMGLGEREKRIVSRIITDLLTQHNLTVQEMNQKHVEKMKEHKKLHDDAHKEARRRERKLRAELDSRSRLIAHNKAIIERYNKEKKEAQQEMAEEMKKMKEDYEEQIRILQESTRIPISTSVPSVQQMNADFNQFYRGLVQTLQQLQHSISQLGDTSTTVLMNTALQQTTQLTTLHSSQMERQKKRTNHCISNTNECP